MPGGPIGVFDSGVGGLTVVAALRRHLPHESIIYLGDTARVPYGTKSALVVQRYAHNCASFLVRKGARFLIVACNTATAFAVDTLERAFTQPVIGVIDPGARLAVEATRNGRVGVIGTEGTISSNSYQHALRRLAPDCQVVSVPCPLFVPFAEEGMCDHPATRLVAQEYLAPLIEHRIDTLVLGCTHYPLLQPLLVQILGPDVVIVDSATAIAREVAGLYERQNWESPRPAGPIQFFATDVSQRVTRVGGAFLGEALTHVELVDI